MVGWDWDLLFAHWTGSASATQGVVTQGLNGRYGSLAIDAADRAFISYYDHGGNLMLATQIDAATLPLRRHLGRRR